MFANIVLKERLRLWEARESKKGKEYTKESQKEKKKGEETEREVKNLKLFIFSSSKAMLQCRI